MKARPFSRKDLPDLLALIAGNAARRPVGLTQLMTSDLAWQFPGCAPKHNIRLWWVANELVAYGWFQPPDTLKFDVHSEMHDPDHTMGLILGWAEQRRRSFPPHDPWTLELRSMDEWAEAIRNPPTGGDAAEQLLVTSALESDHARIAVLAGLGFRRSGHHEPVLVCDLRDAPPLPPPPDGFTLRHVCESDLEDRVALHSAAWAPASGFNVDFYRSVRSMREVFEPELDIVAVAADGTFASYTIAWIDPVSRIGSFEPFGTRPEFRGTGVSEAVIYEGFRRMIGRGMTHARIYTAGFNHQAARLYRRCGFRQVDVNRTWVRSSAPAAASG